MTQIKLPLDDSFPRTPGLVKYHQLLRFNRMSFQYHFTKHHNFMPWLIRSVQYPFLRKKRLASRKPPWIFHGFFYTSRFWEESQYRYSFQLPVMKSSRLFFWAPSVFPGALETRPGAGTLHVQGPGSSMQDEPNGAMRSVTVGDRDLPVTLEPSMWCSKGISGVPQTHQILNKSRQEIMEILSVSGLPKENKPKMKLPLGQRVKFWSTCFMPYRIEVLLKFEIWLSRKVFLSFPEQKHLCFEYTHI